MKLGEIKIETLKLMFTNMNDDIDTDMLDRYMQDENYKGYLYAMPGAINRCFARIEERKVLPSRTRLLKASEGKASNVYIRYDLSALINDFYTVERVVYESKDGEYNGDYDYIMEGSDIVLKRVNEGDSYTVIYKPTITRVTITTPNETEIDIPEGIASYIPYYVKGDLFRDDEPNEASEARNWFEQSLDEITYKQMSKTNSVKSTYSLTEV